MTKTHLTFRKIVCDPFVLVSMLAGVVLMALTLYVRVNPVEGSVVNETVRGTWLQWVLLITTLPAWLAGTLAGPSTMLSYPLMFIVQIALYTGLGLLLRRFHRLLSRQHR